MPTCFAALGTGQRLRIVRLLLLAAHPDGMNAGEIQSEPGIPGSTLPHHLEKLKREELVTAWPARPGCGNSCRSSTLVKIPK